MVYIYICMLCLVHDGHVLTHVGAQVFLGACEFIWNVFIVVMLKSAQASLNVGCWLIKFVHTIYTAW